MMCHAQLDIQNLDKIALFKDEEQKIVGLVTYDTKITDSTYLIHSIDDESLLLEMLDFALNNYIDEEKVTCEGPRREKSSSSF